MNRRDLLGWLSSVLAAACSAIVLVPGVRYVIAALRRRPSSEVAMQRVARLSDLVPGEPVQRAITGSRRDTWTLYPQETIGRVWLVRRGDEDTPPGDSKVDAYTTVCPHLGCSISRDTSRDQFICPCHKTSFDFNGQAVSPREKGRKNPSPRDMDSLSCRIVEDEKTGQWWVEVKYEKFRYGSIRKISRG